MERVRLRQYCKTNMKDYKQFWKEYGDEFSTWFRKQPEERLRKCFQLPRQEVMERLKNQNYILHQAFGTLLCGGEISCFFLHLSNRNCIFLINLYPM